ncbi:MAG: hypothetical protein MI810_19540 [Flavobacteriales bacterium]|nr:hypothetical protein [Flavobacteriales bacterium]
MEKVFYKSESAKKSRRSVPKRSLLNAKIGRSYSKKNPLDGFKIIAQVSNKN